MKRAFENIVEKGENAGYQHFLLTHNAFKKLPMARQNPEFYGYELIKGTKPSLHLFFLPQKWLCF